jgi:hypothetical protein
MSWQETWVHYPVQHELGKHQIRLPVPSLHYGRQVHTIGGTLLIDSDTGAFGQ